MKRDSKITILFFIILVLTSVLFSYNKYITQNSFYVKTLDGGPLIEEE